MTRLMRCETCNIETIWPHKFCSKECEQDFWDAMGEPDDNCIFDESIPLHNFEEGETFTFEDYNELISFLNDQENQ